MKGVSPVVATVLLIALAVIASVTAWFWVSSYTTKPALAETSFRGFTVVGVYKNSSNDGCNAFTIKNTGGQTITNALFYVKDLVTGRPVGSNGTNPSYVAYVNITSANPGNSERFSILALGTGGWVETNISDISADIHSVKVGDANNDGRNDVVIGMASTTNELRMYENKSGGWVETNICNEPNDAMSVAIGDANNDGQKDVVVGVYSVTNSTRMYENKSGGWVETNISDASLVESVAIGDANNDGKNETVIGLYSTTKNVRMYENKSGGWVETNISDLPNYVYSVAIGDANNDGNKDVVVGMDAGTNELRMYENKSGGWVETNISNVPNRVNSVAIGDANNDGKNDVVIGMGTASNGTRMYENKSGGWVETNISNVISHIYSVAIGDANNDGSNDVAMGTTNVTLPFNYNFRMYENRAGGWVETNISDPQNAVYSLDIGDANNDGKNEGVIGIRNGISAPYTQNDIRAYQYVSTATSIPLGTYILRTSSLGFSDQIFTCA
jgi:flagellin-like protein